jgi:hypothetical protein
MIFEPALLPDFGRAGRRHLRASLTCYLHFSSRTHYKWILGEELSDIIQRARTPTIRMKWITSLTNITSWKYDLFSIKLWLLEQILTTSKFARRGRKLRRQCGSQQGQHKNLCSDQTALISQRLLKIQAQPVLCLQPAHLSPA